MWSALRPANALQLHTCSTSSYSSCRNEIEEYSQHAFSRSRFSCSMTKGLGPLLILKRQVPRTDERDKTAAYREPNRKRRRLTPLIWDSSPTCYLKPLMQNWVFARQSCGVSCSSVPSQYAVCVTSASGATEHHYVARSRETPILPALRVTCMGSRTFVAKVQRLATHPLES